MSDGTSSLPSAPPVIRIAAAMISDPSGRLLLVRKRGTKAFMPAGGKIEAGEAPEQALQRELAEELGLSVRSEEPVYLGHRSAPAANEAGHIVEAHLYALERVGEIVPGAEIEELIWLDADRPGPVMLAPLTRDHVLPLHRKRRLHG